MALILALSTAFVIWLLTPFVLLSRRIPWRALVPTGVLTGIGMTAFGIGSVVYMPRAIEESADRYGSIGIAIALVSWLVGAGFVLVGCAVVGAVLGEGRDGTAAAPRPRTDGAAQTRAAAIAAADRTSGPAASAGSRASVHTALIDASADAPGGRIAAPIPVAPGSSSLVDYDQPRSRAT